MLAGLIVKHGAVQRQANPLAWFITVTTYFVRQQIVLYVLHAAARS